MTRRLNGGDSDWSDDDEPEENKDMEKFRHIALCLLRMANPTLFGFLSWNTQHFITLTIREETQIGLSTLCWMRLRLISTKGFMHANVLFLLNTMNALIE